MPIEIGRAANCPVNWMLYVGHITRKELLDAPGRINPDLPEFGPSWIVYVDGQANMSEIDLAVFAEMKVLYQRLIEALATKGATKTVLVSDSIQNDSIVRFWRAYAGNDPDYPSDPAYTTSLQKACGELGLNEADCADVVGSIRAALGRYHRSRDNPDERSGAA
jgi:hypothetical protein